MLTNRPKRFLKTGIFDTGVIDYHKLMLLFLSSHFIRLPPKNIGYRNLKKFCAGSFLNKLNHELLKEKMYHNTKDMFSTFTEVFRSVLDIHAPLKTKKVRGAKGLIKAIMTRLRIANSYHKWSSRESILAMKRTRFKANRLF